MTTMDCNTWNMTVNAVSVPDPDSRYDRGLAKLAEVDGHAGEAVLATVAMLTVLGGREPQLKVHLGASLNVGITGRELEELILQTVPYAGFPTAINAMNALKQVLAETAAPT